MTALIRTSFLFLFTSVSLLSSLSAQRLEGPKKDTDRILALIGQFSQAVMSGDDQAITDAYTTDGKIFPNNREILSDHPAIQRYWTLPEGITTPYHKIIPEEIKVQGDYAYDYGRYEGKTRRADGKENSWKGKYVIVWKKVEGDWKIYLDIWNAIRNPPPPPTIDPMAAHLANTPQRQFPYGKKSPDAPNELTDFAPLIGTCDCRSLKRLSQTDWADTVQMVWTYKYIMNGWAVQDESYDATGSYNSSIRQYLPDSSAWYVTFFSGQTPTPTPSTWTGGKTTDGQIILYRPQTAPNGMAGQYRITFSNISDKGFNWQGDWTSPDESVVYPTWKIWCTKRKE